MTTKHASYRQKDFSIPTTEEKKRLQAKLLAIGGTKVIHLPDEHLPLVFREGELMPTAGLTVKTMEISGCHGNSALLWLKGPSAIRIATGYALSPDGIWRQHSWAVRVGPPAKIIETTIPRTDYYGLLIRQGADSFIFALRNLGNQVLPHLEKPELQSLVDLNEVTRILEAQLGRQATPELGNESSA